MLPDFVVLQATEAKVSLGEYHDCYEPTTGMVLFYSFCKASAATAAVAISITTSTSPSVDDIKILHELIRHRPLPSNP